MNILFLGDLVGTNSLIYIKKNLSNICQKYNISFVIANGENLYEGYGLTPEICDDLFKAGVNVVSSGNHIWDQKEIIPYIAKNINLLKPNNFPGKTSGNGYGLFYTNNGKKILVINLICNLFMRKSDNLFKSVDPILNSFILNQNCDAIVIDLHGEAASEKQAFANYVDGKVSAVIGTHTHVPTSDLRILPHGTTYQTDAGMCGDFDSVIGSDKKEWINKFLNTSEFKKINIASNQFTLCGVILNISDETGLSNYAKQLIIGDTLENKIPNEKYFL